MRLFLVLVLVSSIANVETAMKEGGNYCHDHDAVKRVNKLLETHPDDVLIVRLVGLRVGLCKLVDDKKIPLAQAIDIFEDEKNRAIVERSGEELTKRPDISL